MIELKTWNVLCTFARCGTLLKAAETLHISQPALSKTLAGLESDLGVALFDRTSRNRLKLTPAGENAVKLAGELLEHAQEIEDTLQNSRIFKFATCAPAPAWFIEDTLKDLLKCEVEYTLVEEEEKLLSLLQRGTYRFVILPYAPDNPNLYSRYLMKEPLSLAVPKNHPLAKKEKITFDDLNGQNVLLFQEIGYWNVLVKEQLSKTHFLSIDNRSTFEDATGLNAFPYFVSNYVRNEASEDTIILPVVNLELSYWLVSLEKDTRIKELIPLLLACEKQYDQ